MTTPYMGKVNKTKETGFSFLIFQNHVEAQGNLREGAQRTQPGSYQ